MPPPIAVVQFLCRDFLEDVPGELVEDGEECLSGETSHFGVEWGHIRHRVGGWQGKVRWYHWLDVGLDEW